MDPFLPTFWDQNPNLQPLCFPHSTTSALPVGSQLVDHTLPKGETLFLQPASGVSPPPLPHLQADSAFIERAARFSCFGGVTSSFGLNHSTDPYAKKEANTRKEEGVVDTVMDAGNSNGCGGDDLSGDAEVSGQKEDSNSMATTAKKRRRGATQSVEADQVKGESNNHKELEKKDMSSIQRVDEGDQVPEQHDASNLKLKGKQTKGGEEPPKVDYIHVRARRGQATNSHSLAERVRREKISERMKFLQDLVPGCSKVTGKAVMLDEIINYVQSLQRQVEFLSMKLAAVNPQLEFNIEGLLSKDVFQSHMVPSGSIAFPPNLALPALQQNQQGLIKPLMSGMPPFDAHKGGTEMQIASAGAYGESKLQIPNSWDGDHHNTNQINLVGNQALHIQDMNCETSSRFPT